MKDSQFFILISTMFLIASQFGDEQNAPFMVTMAILWMMTSLLMTLIH